MNTTHNIRELNQIEKESDALGKKVFAAGFVKRGSTLNRQISLNNTIQ